MQEDGVEAAGPDGRRGRTVGSALAKVGGPLAAGGHVLQDGEFDAGGRGVEARGGAEEELLNAINAGAFGGADESDGRFQFGRKGSDVDFAAALGEIVGHVEQHEGGQAEAENGSGEDEIAAEIGDVEDENDGVGFGEIGTSAGEDVVRDLFVFGARNKAIDAGQIDQEDFLMALEFGLAHAVFDGDAREIGDLLAQAGEAVEEGRLAGVGRTDDGDDDGPFAGRAGRQDVGIW